MNFSSLSAQVIHSKEQSTSSGTYSCSVYRSIWHTTEEDVNP